MNSLEYLNFTVNFTVNSATNSSKKIQAIMDYNKRYIIFDKTYIPLDEPESIENLETLYSLIHIRILNLQMTEEF